MLEAKIDSLIDKVDTFEIVRDQIAAILKAEQASQCALADAAGRDSRLWSLRLFTEASNPWEQFRGPPQPNKNRSALDFTPIVNVWFDQSAVSRSGSSQSNRNTTDSTFQVDCYGYGLSGPDGDGQLSGDSSASVNAQRAARLVRNILASAHWVNLGLEGVVGNRWVQQLQGMQVQQGGQQSQHVYCVRVTVNANYPEFSPQYGPGQPFEAANVQITRLPNGEIELFEFDASASP